MGVINITPDSFSTPNLHNDSNSFLTHFKAMQDWADIIDIGAESTAPMNQAISEAQELERYQKIVFPILSSLDITETIISIDTYKPRLFMTVADEFLRYHPKVKLIWNDVSGKLDGEMQDILQKPPFPFTYVYAHNLVPQRRLTNDHMSYISTAQGELFLNEIVTYFQEGMHFLEKCNVPFILDPCFGFSKSREQNQYLLKNIRRFLDHFSDKQMLIGISHKSFLRFPIDNGLEQAENLHALILNKIRSYHRDCIYRIHHSSIKNALENFENYF
jgi:dihydropteroate synthase